MAKRKFFIAGTDTDVGKTAIAAGLLCAAKKKGLTTVAIKPVAAGCELHEGQLRNEDALTLQAEMTHPLPYQQVNPIALKSAIAPHIAAKEENKTLTVSRISGFCNGVSLAPVDWMIVEGAGGWRVPLNARETMADIPKELGLEVILVVAMRLGCINHAILTAEAVVGDGVKLSGWVANTLGSPMPRLEENMESLIARIPAPLLGSVPSLKSPSAQSISRYLDIDLL